jgi:hypothetical protein
MNMHESEPLETIVSIQRWIVTVAAAIIFGCAVYFWTAKRTILTQRRDWIVSGRPRETHEFELLEYRYREIVVWRSVLTGGREAHSEHTFGAWIVKKVVRTEWCGNGSGVLVEAIAQYDYGALHDALLFYDFRKASFLTSLDPRTTGDTVKGAVRRCVAEQNLSVSK